MKLVIRQFLYYLVFRIVQGDGGTPRPCTYVGHGRRRGGSESRSYCVVFVRNKAGTGGPLPGLRHFMIAGFTPDLTKTTMLSTGAIIVLIVSLVFGALFTPLDANSAFVTQKQNEWPVQSKNVLLVTAHPDDEVMFFAPTVLALVKQAAAGNISFYHVCLSYGNADGLGATRKIELGYSLDMLGVARQKRWIINNP